LLLFVQSFGIPVDSMSQLLQCLDSAVAMDPDAMDTAIVDKSYMAQLIEVQRMRGAIGGNKFYQLLLDGHSPPQQLGLLPFILFQYPALTFTKVAFEQYSYSQVNEHVNGILAFVTVEKCAKHGTS
jgi:hypothetical protein